MKSYGLQQNSRKKPATNKQTKHTSTHSTVQFNDGNTKLEKKTRAVKLKESKTTIEINKHTKQKTKNINEYKQSTASSKQHQNKTKQKKNRITTK